MWFSEEEREAMPLKTLQIMFEACFSDKDELLIKEMEDWEVQNCLELLTTQAQVEELVRQDLEERLPDYYFSLSAINEREVVEIIADDYCEEKGLSQEWESIVGADGETYFFDPEEFQSLVEDFVLYY